MGKSLKEFLADFPNQNGTVVAAIFLIMITGLTVVIRLALGLIFPAGYDTWIWALVGLAGVNVLGMVGKRATDINYITAKASQPQITVEAPSTVKVEPKKDDPIPDTPPPQV